MARDTKGEADLRRGRTKVVKRKSFAGASAKGSTGTRAKVGPSAWDRLDGRRRGSFGFTALAAIVSGLAV